jgi:hypothetical protein
MINVFFSYSHKDELLRDELEKHLSILKRQGVINTWHDRRIDAGAQFHEEISNNLKNANIILLLVSPDFLASDYCYDIELKKALEMNDAGDAVVVPVILRPCDWSSSLFGKLMATPADGKPVTKFTNYDDAFLQISEVIKKVVNQQTKNNESTVVKEEPFISDRSLPRSSNMRIHKTFTDHEKDQFMDEAFTYMANFFEGSLLELKRRNPTIDSRFKKIDSQCFTATVYREGKVKSECMIFIGGTFGNHSISYSNHISSSRNSLNNSLSLTDSGEILCFRPGAMSFVGLKANENLTNEGASEYYWEIFIQPLQANF